MYPIAEFYIMLADIVLILVFLLWSRLHGKKKPLDNLFMMLSLSLVIWQGAIIAMRLVDPNDEQALFICDAVSNVGLATLTPITLLIALAFSKRICDKKVFFLLIPSCVTIAMVFTNPLHHLYYRVFSVDSSKLRFGPYFYVQGIYGYLCLLAALYVIISYGVKSHSRTCARQSALFAVSIVVPMVVNCLATFAVVPLSIAATPLAFTVTVLCYAAAIYWLGFLNLAPMALQRIADGLSDAYVVLDDEYCVYSCNKSFSETFAQRCCLVQGRSLSEACQRVQDDGRTFLYSLKSSVESAGKSRSAISYEQTFLQNGRRRYYVVEITPLLNGVELRGYLAMFRDVTRLRESMKSEQESLSRSMERERLASLGQMIGGIAHNLKTPIMSISGSVNMLSKLTEEYQKSIGDSEVTEEDHQAISEEMMDWQEKIRSCCAYMSDIITTVKGLAANMNTTDTGEFTVDELMKRVELLLQHELKRGKCKMTFVNDLQPSDKITGDVNNLVQVVSNLVGNAIDAMPQGGDIIAHAFIRDKNICLSVTDQGTGIPPHIQEKLFKEMFTSKGVKGTGLGLYMSSALMRGKFGGTLKLEETSVRGSTFCLTIPLPDETEEGKSHA